jgi:hypothetical protein
MAGGLVLVGLFLIGSPVTAQQRVGPAATPTANPKAALVAQLRATRALLHQANHDYKGHRVKAMHEITVAIHALQPPAKKHHAKPGAPKPATAGSKPASGGHEPQAISDAQLQKSIQQLQTIQSQLGTIATGNVGVAHTAIGKAIQELQTALKII